MLAEKIIKKKLSVRQTESLIKILKDGKNKTIKSKDANILAAENSLTDKIGMRVSIIYKSNNSGVLSFEYKELGQLDRLIDIVKNNY